MGTQMKKTNAKPKKPGGVNKDPNLRVKVKSSELALVKAEKKTAVVLKKKLSKLKPNGLISILGDAAEDIQNLLEVGNNDSAIQLIYKKLLQSTIDLLPLAEHAIRNTEGARGVYQYNSLISSIRELLADIQSAQDRGMLGEALVEKIIRPSYMDIGMTILKEFKALSDDASDLMSQENHQKFLTMLRKTRGNVGDMITSEYTKVQNQTRDYLQR